jgi:hypothetical protein
MVRLCRVLQITLCDDGDEHTVEVTLKSQAV